MNISKNNRYTVKTSNTMLVKKLTKDVSTAHTIWNSVVQTLLSCCFLNRYISPVAVITLVTFFRTITIFKLVSVYCINDSMGLNLDLINMTRFCRFFFPSYDNYYISQIKWKFLRIRKSKAGKKSRNYKKFFL